jgi:hypothetical protein
MLAALTIHPLPAATVFWNTPSYTSTLGEQCLCFICSARRACYPETGAGKRGKGCMSHGRNKDSR